MIYLNFKTYPQATTDDNALKLAQIAQKVATQCAIPITVCLQATDIYKVAQTVDIPVFGQHVDPIEPGKHTGAITALALKQAGAAGALLNHSEHRILSSEKSSITRLKKTISIAKSNGLKTLVCVESPLEARQVDPFGPDAIALEDASLIGSNRAIVNNPQGRQKVIEFINLKLKRELLVGAGITSQADVVESRQLGAAGVLISSGFVLAAEPTTTLTELSRGFNQQ